jgi:hypothetical protein
MNYNKKEASFSFEILTSGTNNSKAMLANACQTR